MLHKLRLQRGAAIVLAMLLAALAAAVAATVFADQQRWSRMVEHRSDQVQAQALAMAGVQWARQILYDDARQSVIDHLGEPWALALPPIPLENGEIRGTIADAQARLNVNALGASGTAAGVERDRLVRLFQQRNGPAAAIDAIADWIDADSALRSGGAEDAYYAAQTGPGLAANAPAVRVYELAEVKGVTARSLARVADFVIAVPAGTPTNINTASPEVLSAIVGNLSGDAAAALVAGRAKKPYTTIAEFRARLPPGSALAAEDALSVKSDYFLATIEARQGQTRARARALLHRGGSAWPTVIWQVVE